MKSYPYWSHIGSIFGICWNENSGRESEGTQFVSTMEDSKSGTFFKSGPGFVLELMVLNKFRQLPRWR
jgi:hypothetical protein